MSPIVGSVSPRYLKHRANAWVNGFTLVYVRGDGTFNLYQVVITDGVAQLRLGDIQPQRSIAFAPTSKSHFVRFKQI